MEGVWTEEQYDEFVRESYEYLKGVQEAAKQDFALGSYERFDWDQEKGTLTFSDRGVSKVIAHVDFVVFTSIRWASES